ncbi:pimeloyl-ACP methyl ester carboxylesterase [Amorphus suaedae]
MSRKTTLGLLSGLAAGAAMMAAAVAQDAELKTVANGDATIAYYAQGEGPIVLFIASTGRGNAEFDDLASDLAGRGFRVLRPEPRGIGESVGPMEDVSFHDFGNDVAAVIHNEGGGPAIVAGHAYGNWIARTVAADHPEMVRGVVLVAAGARKWPKELSDAITMINDPASTEEQRLQGLRTAFFAPGSDPRPWLEGWHADVTRSQRAARKQTEQSSWWDAGGKPILDLQAGEDPFRPAASRNELAEEFGDRVTVVVIEGASHALPAEKPKEVADAIAKWAGTLKD